MQREFDNMAKVKDNIRKIKQKLERLFWVQRKIQGTHWIPLYL